MERFSFIEQTIGDIITSHAQIRPNADALIYPFHGIRMTWADLDRETDLLAKGLLKMGIRKGDHIAVWAHNVPEWVLILFASAKIGAVLVTVNTLYRAAELEYILHQSDSVALFLVEHYKTLNYVETVNEVVPEVAPAKDFEITSKKHPFLRRVIQMGGEKTFPGIMNFDELYTLGAMVDDSELKKVRETLNPHDVINMQYTSGTTGFPKGVMLTHYNIVNNGYAIGQRMKFTEKDRLCITVPFFHCFGLVLGVMACITNATAMVPVEQFNPVEVLKTVETERCTALHGVPTMFISELQLLEKQPYDLTSLRTGIMAGTTCPVEVMKQVMDKMNMKDITIVYGLTEASPGMTQTTTDDPVSKRVETVGKELPGCEVKVINPETGEECPPNVPGEIVGRGYNIMRGYYKMKEATQKAITTDGWLHTGDLGIKTEDGYYVITGRIKDVIIRGGENIYPREIEEFLYRHPEVEDVQIVGVPDQKYGEECMAFIRKKAGSSVTPEDIRAFCKGKIADYKIPRYVEFIDEYPATASGKIQKYKLRELGTCMLQGTATVG